MNVSHNLPTTITKVESVDKNFKITWMLDLPCNYDCSYCYPNYHVVADRYTKFKSLDTMKTEWLEIYKQVKNKNKNKKINIHFTGGELTINKNFSTFVEWLRENFVELDFISLTSNGSASKKYYSNLIKHLSNLTLSTHLEFFNENKFFELVSHLHSLDNKILYIQLMNEHFYPDNKIHQYITYLEGNGIPYTLMNINNPSLGENITLNNNTKEFNFYEKE